KRPAAAGDGDVVGPMPMPKVPPMGERGGPMGPGGIGAGANRAPWDRDALVRFIDPDVVPGKTYQYYVKVFLANPNYKKKADVAFTQLADIPYLESKIEVTPTITIPKESFLYAGDPHLLAETASAKAQPK